MEDSTLFRTIQERCDPDEVIDILGIETGRLCLLLRREVLQAREKFEDYLEIGEPNDAAFGMHMLPEVWEGNGEDH